MIRQGLLCKYCTGKECKDLGTKQEPIEIKCPSCNGNGCDECKLGMFNLDGCPNAFCGEMAQTISLIDLFGKGLPPVTGGALDQAAWFVDAVRILNNEEALARIETNE